MNRSQIKQFRNNTRPISQFYVHPKSQKFYNEMFNILKKYENIIHPVVNAYLTASKNWLPNAMQAEIKKFNLMNKGEPITKNLQNELGKIKSTHNSLARDRTKMLNMLEKNDLKNNGGRSAKQNASSVLNDLRTIRNSNSKEAVRAAVNRITNNSKNNMARRAAFMFLQRPNAENIVKKLMA